MKPDAVPQPAADSGQHKSLEGLHATVSVPHASAMTGTNDSRNFNLEPVILPLPNFRRIISATLVHKARLANHRLC